jgi:hypothetical protein
MNKNSFDGIGKCDVREKRGDVGSCASAHVGVSAAPPGLKNDFLILS